MVADWNEPDNSSLYTDVLADLNAKILSCVLLDPSADSNIPDNAFMIDQADGNSLKQYDLGGDTWSLVNFKVDDFTCDDITAATLAATSSTVTTSNATTANVGTFSNTGATDGFEIQAAYINSSRDATSEQSHFNLYNTYGLVGKIFTLGDDIGIESLQSSFTLEAVQYLVVTAGTEFQVNAPTQINSYLQQGTFSTTGASRGCIFPAGGGYLQMSNSNTSTYNHLSFYNTNGLLGLISTTGNDFKIESTVDSMTIEGQDELYLIAAASIRLNCTSIIIDAGSFQSDVIIGSPDYSGTSSSRGLEIDSQGYMLATTESTASYGFYNCYTSSYGLTGRIRTNGGNCYFENISDVRKKKNIETVKEKRLAGERKGRDKLKQIQVIEYHMTEQDEEEPKILGFSAQQIAELMPEHVDVVEGENILFDKSVLIPHLVDAVDDIDDVVELLKTQVAELSTEVLKLKSEKEKANE